jgi:hypothetical protein
MIKKGIEDQKVLKKGNESVAKLEKALKVAQGGEDYSSNS